MTETVTMWSMLVAYKMGVLFVGLCFGYMGYRLFLADKVASAGDLTGRAGTYSLTLTGAAPGIFFSLFGAIIIAVSLSKGIDYADREAPSIASAPVPVVIPEQPPQANSQ